MKMKKIWLFLSTLTIGALPLTAVSCLFEAKKEKEVEDVNLRQQSNLLIKKDQKIKYVAFGDSVSAGFDGSLEKDYPGKRDEKGNIDGASYPAFLARALDVNSRVEKFENFSISGSTLETWNQIIFGDLEKNDKANFKNLFGNDFKNIITKMRESLKESNLITFNLGANDFIFPLLWSLLKPEIIGKVFQGDLNFNDVILKLAPEFTKMLQTIQEKFIVFVNKLKELAPKANINILGYPLPGIWFENTINNFIKQIKGYENFDYNKFFSDKFDTVFKNLSTKTGINYINAFNHNYWKENKKTLTSLSFDIHPGINGYKKMALDIYLKITNRLYKKEDFDKLGKFDFTDEYIKDDFKLAKHQIEVDNYNEVIQKIFGASSSEYELKKSGVETELDKLKSTTNFGKRIKMMFPNLPVLLKFGFIKLMESDFFKKIDDQNKIKEFLNGTSKNNQKPVIDNLIESIVKSDLIETIIALLDTKIKEAFEKNPNGNIMLSDFIQIMMQSFSDQKVTSKILTVASIEPFSKDFPDLLELLISVFTTNVNEEKKQLLKLLGIPSFSFL